MTKRITIHDKPEVRLVCGGEVPWPSFIRTTMQPDIYLDYGQIIFPVSPSFEISNTKEVFFYIFNVGKRLYDKHGDGLIYIFDGTNWGEASIWSRKIFLETRRRGVKLYREYDRRPTSNIIRMDGGKPIAEA
ncbi:MAG: hypothetical protein AAF583_01505 [Pseudomonadota bacterium]